MIKYAVAVVGRETPKLGRIMIGIFDLGFGPCCQLTSFLHTVLAVVSSRSYYFGKAKHCLPNFRGSRAMSGKRRTAFLFHSIKVWKRQALFTKLSHNPQKFVKHGSALAL